MSDDADKDLDEQTPEQSVFDEAADPAAQIEQLRDELSQAQDHALRAKAELENFRKRLYREMEEQRRYANMDLIRDLLPVMDNLQRAIESAERNEAAAGLLEGVTMVAQQFMQVLEKHHCTRIEALGQPFDPSRHEAIQQQPSEDHPHHTVLIEAMPGYQLHDRIVRPSQVIVSKKQQEEG